MRSQMVPVLERLEQRLCLSGAGVAVVGDALYINGDGRSQIVQITDGVRSITGPTDPTAANATVVSIDFNGNGSFDDPGDLHRVVYRNINKFVVTLAGGNDSFSFTIGSDDGGYSSANKSLSVDLGSGSDVFSIGMATFCRFSNTQMSVSVNAGNGNDQAYVGLGSLGSSDLSINLNMGNGNDTVGFGVSSYGTHFRADSMVQLSASLGNGDDTFRGDLWYEDGFSIEGGSQMMLNADGGAGNDSLTLVAHQSGWTRARIYGTMLIGMSGGSGDDSIDVNLKAPLTMSSGRVDIRADGGTGNDALWASLATDTGSTGGIFNVALLGGDGDDALSADLNDSVGVIHYNPGNAGKVLLDGGAGANTYSAVGNAPYDVR